MYTIDFKAGDDPKIREYRHSEDINNILKYCANLILIFKFLRLRHGLNTTPSELQIKCTVEDYLLLHIFEAQFVSFCRFHRERIYTLLHGNGSVA